MASASPMELLDASEMSKRHGPLAVNKASGRIAKGLRRPVAQPRPAPTVYKIEAGDFRSLVQELTGTAPTEAAASRPAGNSRLHKIAPPPLRPTFLYPEFGVQSTHHFANGLSNIPSPTGIQMFKGIPFGGFGPSLSPLSQKYTTPLSLLSPHSFSPLPALSPNDQWANPLESPGSAAIRQLAQSMSGNDQQMGEVRRDGSNGGVSQTQSSFTSFSTPNFSLSPKFSTQYSNLPSPVGIGMSSGFGINNIYRMGALNSPTGFQQAAAGGTMDFTFPEPDFVSTGFH